MKRAQRFASAASLVARGLSRIERDEICCGDLTLQQFDTLRMLRDAGATAVGAAARQLGIDISTASRNLSVLEREGYVERARSKEDARQVVFALAPKGAECLASLCCDERTVFAALLARVPASERESVVRALETLADALSDKAPSNACFPPGTCAPTGRETR